MDVLSHVLGIPKIGGGGGVAAPEAPTITAPTDNSDITDSTPTLQWNAVDGATGYFIVSSINSNLSSPIEETDVGNVTTAAFTTPLSPFRDFYLGVYAYNAGGNSATAAVHVYLVNQSFNQALGSELITDGEFANWAGANDLTSWTEIQSPPDRELTQVDSGQLHGGSSGTGGSVNFFASSSASSLFLTQEVSFTQNAWYIIENDISAYGNGTLSCLPNNSGKPIGVETNGRMSSSGNRRQLYFGRFTSSAYRFVGVGGGSLNITNDRTSAKQLTTVSAKFDGLAQGTIQAEFTRPTSPLLDEAFALLFNADTANPGNFWLVALIYNGTGYDAKLYSYNASDYTQQEAVTNVGNADGIGISFNGTTRQMQVLVGGTWTDIGSGVEVSLHDSADEVQVIYTQGYTPRTVRVSAGFF